jgi:DNA-binding SARP family transcriptional activator
VLNESLPEEEALSLCFAGVELYRGDFLPKAEYESWVIPISTYYHTLYQKLIHYTIHLLTAKKAFSQITALCQTAIAIEPFDEEFRYQLVYSLYRDGHTHQALWISFTVSFPSPPLIILRICIRSSVMTNRVST